MNMDDQIYARTADPDEVAEAAKQAKKAKTAKAATITKTVLDDGQNHSRAMDNPFAKGGLFDTSNDTELFVDLSWSDMRQIMLGAAVTGAVTGAILLLVAGSGLFGSSTFYITIIAAVVAVIVGLIIIMQRRVYRPALVMLATVAALWPVMGWLTASPWYIVLPVTTILFMLSIGVFSWISRLRNVVIAIGAMLAIVVLVTIISLL